MSKRAIAKCLLEPPARVKTPARNKPQAYSAFEAIDGRHPWQESVPEGCVLYPVRALKRGEVAYFNYFLAKEMGLLPDDHPHTMTAALARTLQETFSLQIINEYDQSQRRHLLRQNLKPNPYMATRYLQLQHANKQGKTSGDGRGIWNGTFKSKGVTWDISSRGTGVTKLAPGAVVANRPLKTGAGDFGYGCGMADIDELLSSALMSEVFHLRGIPTERVLAIIDLGKGVGIGVRAAPNLLRPAHLFLWLKQEKLEPLRRGTDHFIQRQAENHAGEMWRFKADAPDRYQRMLRAIAVDFAKFAAALERNYIFAWLDWDGDNVLASAGIIDYGSIRQFGLRHDQYRYDDVDRFSTNLNEQRGKARLTVQVFAQMVDFVTTGKRRPVESFSRHPILSEFDRAFGAELRRIFLAQIGCDEDQVARLMREHRSSVERLYQAFSLLERTKTKDKLKRVADGVNRPAVFKMRAVLRELPSMLRSREGWMTGDNLIPAEELMTLMASSFARRRDLALTGQLRARLIEFQKSYTAVIRQAQGNTPPAEFFRNLTARAQQENMAGRITGNSTEFLIDALLNARKRGLSPIETQKAMDLFISQQVPHAKRRSRRAAPLDLDSPAGRLFQDLLQIALEFEDEI
ncbi:MAG: hypothetical protein NDI61_05040 [Bdellovibrionaceae bacterium]|nr:hypothetical protein [Pseudobdellovibrionaceae bacterium]